MAKTRFSKEFNCNQSINVRSMGADGYRVSGCGSQASYVCKGTTCLREYSDSDRSVTATYIPKHARTPRQQSAPTGKVVAHKGEDGSRTLRAKLGSKKFSIHLQARPGKDEGMVFIGLRILSRLKGHEECSLRLMADGKMLDMGETGYRFDHGYEELRTTISYDDLFLWGESSRVIGRVCDDEFRIGPERLEIVREFVVRVREEMAWLDHDDEGGEGEAAQGDGQADAAEADGDAEPKEGDAEERGELL